MLGELDDRAAAIGAMRRRSIRPPSSGRLRIAIRLVASMSRQLDERLLGGRAARSQVLERVQLARAQSKRCDDASAARRDGRMIQPRDVPRPPVERVALDREGNQESSGGDRGGCFSAASNAC